MSFRFKINILAILAALTARLASAQTDPERLRLVEVLAQHLATRLAAEKIGLMPCVLATPYGADAMLMKAPAEWDSVSRALAHEHSADSSLSFLPALLIDTSADRASLDSMTGALLGSLARIIGKSGRTIDSSEFRELGIFSFKLERDSAVLGLAYGGYQKIPPGHAYWDVFAYRFSRVPDGWRITADTALMFMDGRRLFLTTAAASRVEECLR